MKVLIIGGVAGGASAAARLRRLDENAEIIMFEKGAYISYANCGLPYYIGGEITDKGKLTVMTADNFSARFNIDVRVNSEVLSIDRKNKTVQVLNVISGETYAESYDKIIISTGAEPVKPPLEGIDDARIFTLRNIPDTYKIKDFIESSKPRTAIVVGGGFIGLEMAENLVNAGLFVTVVEFADHVIAPIDYDTACEVHRYLRFKGVNLILGAAVQSFKNGNQNLDVSLSDGRILNTDMVIMSVGVRPDSKLAKDAGLDINKKGAIITDEHMLTSDFDIYAVGDAVEIKNFITKESGYVPLAGPANKQGRIAADNIAGIPSVYKGTQGSSIMKLFDMTIAATGLNETGAKNAGIDYDKIHTLSLSHAGYYPNAYNIGIKTLFDKKSGRILGAQMTGFDGVDKRIDVMATAIRAQMTAFDLAELELSYAPPYSSAKDPVNMVGFAIENLITGRVKQFQWEEIPVLRQDKSAVFLDIRTNEERAAGALKDSVHIPLHELRGKLSDLDKSKKYYVYCQSGLRSYYACRILSQNGFDCHNLSGGFLHYEKVASDCAFNGDTLHACGLKL